MTFDARCPGDTSDLVKSKSKSTPRKSSKKSHNLESNPRRCVCLTSGLTNGYFDIEGSDPGDATFPIFARHTDEVPHCPVKYPPSYPVPPFVSAQISNLPRESIGLTLQWQVRVHSSQTLHTPSSQTITMATPPESLRSYVSETPESRVDKAVESFEDKPISWHTQGR